MFFKNEVRKSEIIINRYIEKMNLKNASGTVLEQLTDIIKQIGEGDYARTIPSLNATVGQHVRHIVEFYICLFEGLQTGKVNYDQRKRDKKIEADQYFAIDLIQDIIRSINEYDNNPALQLEVMYGETSNRFNLLETNYERELAYNIEHTIHHMAIVRQGFIEICPYIKLPDNFGTASSTIRYAGQG